MNELTIEQRLAALAIPAVDDYLVGLAKGVPCGELMPLQTKAIAALLTCVEALQKVASGPYPKYPKKPSATPPEKA